MGALTLLQSTAQVTNLHIRSRDLLRSKPSALNINWNHWKHIVFTWPLHQQTQWTQPWAALAALAALAPCQSDSTTKSWQFQVRVFKPKQTRFSANTIDINWPLIEERVNSVFPPRWMHWPWISVCFISCVISCFFGKGFGLSLFASRLQRLQRQWWKPHSNFVLVTAGFASSQTYFIKRVGSDMCIFTCVCIW